MAKKGKSGPSKKLPQEKLDRIKKILDDKLEENQFSLRQAETAWRIDRSSLSIAHNAKGAVGFGFLFKLRELTGRSLDDLLGLEPLPVAVPSPAEKTELSKQLEAALADAVTLATSMGTPLPIIAHVRKVITVAIPEKAHRRRMPITLRPNEADQYRDRWVRAFFITWAKFSLLTELPPEVKAWLEQHPHEPPLSKQQKTEEEDLDDSILFGDDLKVAIK